MHYFSRYQTHSKTRISVLLHFLFKRHRHNFCSKFNKFYLNYFSCIAWVVLDIWNPSSEFECRFGSEFEVQVRYRVQSFKHGSSAYRQHCSLQMSCFYVFFSFNISLLLKRNWKFLCLDQKSCNFTK